jgi:hypothetical protein
MKILKTLSILLLGAMVGSIFHFYAFADKVSVPMAESSYQQSVLLLKDQEAKYDKLIEARTQDIQSVMQQYREPLDEIKKLKKKAGELVCKRESDLAQAKLAEHYQDKLPLTTQDVQRLTEKSEWTCGLKAPNASGSGIKVEVAAMSPLPLIKTEAVAEPELCTKKDVDEDQQQYVRMAAEISNNDIDFLATLNQENGTWDPKKKAYGNEDSWGFCMFNRIWHSKVVDDPRFFTEPEWQMQKCYEAYKGGTRFYGFDVRKKSYDKFTCPNQS